MNKKFSSLVASTVHQESGGGGGAIGGGSDMMAGMTTPGYEAQVVKFKKLKIKQQKIKDHKKGSGSGSSDHHSKPSGFTSLFLPSSSSSAITSSPSHHTINPLEQLRKDMILSSLLYSLNQSILTIPCPLPPFLLPDHFKSFLKFSLKSSSSQSLIPSFQLLAAASSPLAIADAANSPTQDLNLSPPPVPTTQGGGGVFDLSMTSTAGMVITSPDDMVTINLNLPPSFKIKEYAPIVFASLRDKVFSFGTKTLYKQSLFHPVKGPPIKYSAMSHDSTQHKSSPSMVNKKLLYTSSDNLLHIKGIDGQEVEQLLSLLRSLHPYLVQRKSNVTKVTRDVTGSNQPTTTTATSAGAAPGAGGSGPSNQSIVNSLLPQYMAVFRLSYPQHIHSLSSVVSSVSSAASSASKGIKGSTSSESHTYLLILRNPLSSERTFFPIHHTYHLTADGIKHVYGSGGTAGGKSGGQQQASGQSTENNDFTLILRKEDADKLLSNLESDLKFLAAHLLVNYTLLIGVHSLDLWEQQLEEDAEDDEDVLFAEGDESGTGIQTLTQQLKGLKSSSGAEEEQKKSDGSGKDVNPKRLSIARKESLSLVIDPVRHPFAIPSPFVTSEGASSSADMDSSEGRFVYFVGFDDLIPLSASFSSKELNIEKVLCEKKSKDKKSESDSGKKDKKSGDEGKSMAHSGDGGAGAGGQDKENIVSDTKKDDQEMGKKEAAREYSKHLMAQVKKRIKVVTC